MRFSLRIRYSDPASLAQLVRAAEDLGLDGIWVTEPWGFDAGAVLGWCVANTRRILIGTHVVSVFARSPAATAGLAGALQSLSGARFRLGLGTSGPSVVEGWHGVPFVRPVARTRDTIAVVRAALRGEPVCHDGVAVTVPMSGRPLRFAQLPHEMQVPIYLGALGPLEVYTFGSRCTGRSAIPETWIKNVAADEPETALVRAGLEMINREDTDAPAAQSGTSAPVAPVVQPIKSAATDRPRPRVVAELAEQPPPVSPPAGGGASFGTSPQAPTRTAPVAGQVEELPVASVLRTTSSTGAPATKVTVFSKRPRPASRTNFGKNLTALLASGQGVAMAVVLQEILGPPKAKKNAAAQKQS